jgi:hypothetical protein
MWPLVGLTLTSMSMALAVWLSLESGETQPESPTSTPDVPAIHAVEGTPAVVPDVSPPPVASQPKSNPVSVPVPVPVPISPTPGTTPPKPKKDVLSFSDRAKKALRTLGKSAQIRNCFSAAVTSMSVAVRVSAVTGIASVVVPDHRTGGAPAKCIQRAFERPLLSRGAPGERDYVQNVLNLPQ